MRIKIEVKREWGPERAEYSVQEREYLGGCGDKDEGRLRTRRRQGQGQGVDGVEAGMRR